MKNNLFQAPLIIVTFFCKDQRKGTYNLPNFLFLKFYMRLMHNIWMYININFVLNFPSDEESPLSVLLH